VPVIRIFLKKEIQEIFVKTLLPHLLILSSLLLLASCGSGGTSNASLQVSHAFAMTNPNFAGGLIVTGKNINTGENFSQGLVNNSEVKFFLKKGTWVFAAIGWDGGTAPEKLFTGKPFCGFLQKDIINESETVNLVISPATCATNAFALAFPESNVNLGLRKVSTISTCRTLFASLPLPTSTSSINSFIANSATADGFCDTGTDSSVWNTEIKSIKFHAVNKGPNVDAFNAGFESPCLNTVASTSVINPTDMRLPLNNIPLIVTTYKETNCQKQNSRFDFKSGLGNTHPDFDHLLLSKGANEIKLILPSSDIKRGLSPFAHLLPQIKIKPFGGTDGRVLTAPQTGTNTYYARTLQAMDDKIILKGENNCTGMTISNVAAGYSCTNVDEGIEINFRSQNAASDVIITVGSNNYSITVDDPGSGDADYVHQRHTSQGFLLNLFGSNDSSLNPHYYNRRKDDDDDRKHGILSFVRNMLDGDGAGGVVGIADRTLSFENACKNVVKDKVIQIFDHEKNQFETYRVKVGAASSTPTSFICDNTSDNSACPTGTHRFDKRMMIWDYKLDTINPMMVMEFSCSDLVGKMETREIETRADRKEERRVLLNWNTSATHMNLQRFEKMTHFRVFNSVNGQLLEDFREISRVAKNNAVDKLDIRNFRFTSSFDGATNKYYEKLERFQTAYKMLSTTSTQFCLDYLDSPSNTSGYSTIEGIFSEGGYNASQASAVPTFAKSYDVGASFPQPMTSPGSCSTLVAPNSNLNGSLAWSMSTLKSITFSAEFGKSFYTAP
jgi:hypothetical protein